MAVAAASDLNFAIKEVIGEFEKQTGHRVKVSLGSSGNFYAQLQQGAPFDLYFSADIGYPKKLEEGGLTVPGSLYRYAVGRVVLWAPMISTQTAFGAQIAGREPTLEDIEPLTMAMYEAGRGVDAVTYLGVEMMLQGVARALVQWTAQYEWHAHHRLALQAGLDPKVAEAISRNERPASMKDDEAVIHDFVKELLDTKQVSDARYKAVVDKFGEQGVMDLIGVTGYYTLVAMVLNVDRTPMPGDAKPPLAPLK